MNGKIEPGSYLSLMLQSPYETIGDH